MDTSLKTFFKNASYTFSSNFTSFIVNAVVVLIIPKLIGVAEYGYFQFYMLLATYALYFHFGWCDGIYLRYVGKRYDELDRPLMSSQFIGVFMMATLLLFILETAVQMLPFGEDKRWIFTCAAVVVFLVIPKTYASVVMQATNKMKEYSTLVIIEKLVYAILLVFMLVIGIRDYKILIFSDIAGKLAAMLIGVYYCRDIIQTKFKWSWEYWTEAVLNVKVGLFLLISNLASILITGIVQFCIESKWDIETFSKVSLTFNMSRMLLVVIIAMSIIMVPMLKHMDEKHLAGMYKKIRSILMVVLAGMLVFYYPLKVILSAWLPQYETSLVYMALLFPMCLFESKTAMLVNTYLKAMRKEKVLCLMNIITVIMSAFLSFIFVYVISNLNLAILSIPMLLAFRCILLEFVIGRKLKIHLMKDATIEVGLATCFIGFSWYINSWMSFLLYLLVYIIYVLINKSSIFAMYQDVRERF